MKAQEMQLTRAEISVFRDWCEELGIKKATPETLKFWRKVNAEADRYQRNEIGFSDLDHQLAFERVYGIEETPTPY